MHIEGYLFVEHHGQYRFSLEVHENERMVKGQAVKSMQYNGLALSNRVYDYHWDIEMRGRPTLHELMDKEYVNSKRIYIGWKDAIYERLNRDIQKILNSKNTTMRCKVGGGYVEFVHVVKE